MLSKFYCAISIKSDDALVKICRQLEAINIREPMCFDGKLKKVSHPWLRELPASIPLGGGLVSDFIGIPGSFKVLECAGTQ